MTPSITCPICGATSHNPHDAATGYCGRCHDFTSLQYGPPIPGGRVILDPPTFGPRALVYAFTAGYLPPPWFVPGDAPACCAVLHVPPAATNDGIERHYICDRVAGHIDQIAGPQNQHRQVIDNDDSGYCFMWMDHHQQQVDAYVTRVTENLSD